MLNQKNDSLPRESWQVPAMRRTEQNSEYEKGEAS